MGSLCPSKQIVLSSFLPSTPMPLPASLILTLLCAHAPFSLTWDGFILARIGHQKLLTCSLANSKKKAALSSPCLTRSKSQLRRQPASAGLRPRSPGHGTGLCDWSGFGCVITRRGSGIRARQPRQTLADFEEKEVRLRCLLRKSGKGARQANTTEIGLTAVQEPKKECSLGLALCCLLTSTRSARCGQQL